jgi:hypothetical protein
MGIGIPSILRLVRADDGQQAIALKECASRLVGEKVGATPHVIMHKALRSLLLPKVLYGIGPEKVAHKTRRWWLTEPIQLKGKRVRYGQ